MSFIGFAFIVSFFYTVAASRNSDFLESYNALVTAIVDFRSYHIQIVTK